MRRIQTDVAIIGAGASGIPAAIEAAQAGVKVDVYEQSDKYGGPCNGGNGVFAVESKMQKVKQSMTEMRLQTLNFVLKDLKNC